MGWGEHSINPGAQVFGSGKKWHWFFLYDMGDGVFYDTYYSNVGGVGYQETQRVIRNYSPWGFPKTGVPNEYAWTSYGWVIQKVYEGGNPCPIAQEIVLMEYRDSD